MHFSEGTVRKLMHSLDLTEYETRAYLSLLEYGPLVVSKVTGVSGIPRPKCYDVLKSLQSKGFVSRILSKPMKYQALPVGVAFSSRLLQIRKELERREEETKELKGEIEKSLKKRVKGRESRVMFFENARSIVSSMVTDAANAKKEILIAISRSPVAHRWTEYFEEYRKSLDKGVHFKFLVPSKNHFMSEVLKVGEIKKYIEGGQFEVKNTHIIDQPFVVIDGGITYIYLTDPLRREFVLAIRIDDEIFAKHMRSIFELLWG